MITQYHSPSPNNNSPFKTLLRPSDAPYTIPEDSLCEPYGKSPTSTPPSIRRNIHQLHSASHVTMKRHISQEKISRQYSLSPSGISIDYRKPDSYSSNSSSPLKRMSIEESFITDSMLLRSSRSVDHSRRYSEGSSSTITRLRSNTLPRMQRRESSHHEKPSSLPTDDPLGTLNKDFFLSGLIDRENSIPIQKIKSAFSNSGSRKSSSGTEPIFSLMEISEEEPFTNCMTALTDAVIIVDEIMRMAKQREGNIINFSREVFSLVRNPLVVCMHAYLMLWLFTEHVWKLGTISEILRTVSIIHEGKQFIEGNLERC